MVGLIALGVIVAPFAAAPKPYPDLSITTPYGAWAATLPSSLVAPFALASSIPMRLIPSRCPDFQTGHHRKPGKIA